MKPISMEEFSQAQAEGLGWCKECKAFTRECTEPDAEDYNCPRCDGVGTVVGVETAYNNYLILIDEEENKNGFLSAVRNAIDDATGDTIPSPSGCSIETGGTNHTEGG